MLVRDADQLDLLLTQLRRARGDHQWVEAKRCREQLPHDLWTTLSAFANEGGGVILLGVDEKAAFSVSGVAHAGKIQADLAALCERMKPPLRPSIDVVAHADGDVIVTQVGPVPRAEQPCHFPDKGTPFETSYIRVGDADVRLTHNEVAEMLSAGRSDDTSRRTAGPEAVLDEAAATATFGEAGDPRNAALRRQGIVDDDGHPTLAGWLALGDHPEDQTPLARIACRRAPRSGDLAGTVQQGEHVEGTVGELLDAALDWLEGVLDTVQVVRDGHVYDQLDFPDEALREALSNALIHRSFSEAMDSTTISIEVTDTTVSITSPGGLHRGVDLEHLGIAPMSTPRNYALVKVCERIRTPRGARIVESQASGIARADDVCRRAGAAPLLFDVHPARVTVVALRGGLDPSSITAVVPDLANQPDLLRVAVFAKRLHEIRDADPGSALHRVHLDATLATRLLATGRTESGLRTLSALTDVGVLTGHGGVARSVWAFSEDTYQRLAAKAAGTTQVQSLPSTDRPEDKQRSSRQKQVPVELLQALAAGPSLGRTANELALATGLAPSTVRKHIKRALDTGLVDATTVSAHDPDRGYILTDLGRRQLR